MSEDTEPDPLGLKSLQESAAELFAVDGAQADQGVFADRDTGEELREPLDPYNALTRRCHVAGSPEGPLAGLRIGVKDHIPIAGAPMGGHYPGEPRRTPSEDAVVVERMLDAGGIVVAKTSTGRTEFGDTRNPLNPEFSPGFSSSGSGAAVAAGLVDVAVGTDLAGSVRIPAAWCGLVGMKPTAGLVPTLQGLPSPRMNEVGPITPSVAENALLLEALAGEDWRDPRTTGFARPAPGDYVGAAADGVDGLRVGVVVESSSPAIGADAHRTFRAAVATLERLGASVTWLSVPLWPMASTIILAELAGDRLAYDWLEPAIGRHHDYTGRLDESVFSSAERLEPPAALPPEVADYIHRPDGLGRMLARTRNLTLALRRQVDDALRAAEVLVTPTIVTTPYRLDDTVLDQDLLKRVIRNTCPLNLTGHPALSVPSGIAEDGWSPSGLQLIGRRADERTLYRVAFAFEQASPTQ